MSGVEREQGQVPAPWPCGGGERGGFGQRGMLTSKGPRPAVAWARWRQAVVGHAAPSRAERGGVRSGGPHLEERGAHGPRLEHMGWPRRRKELGRA
jgi:hypothetical protein